MDVLLKTKAIEYQVLSEADERENQLFFEQISEWLHLENVDAQLRDHTLMRLELILGNLAKANRHIKSLMDIDAQLVA